MSEKIKKKSSYDFYLIMATAIVLAVISAICVYGMFYFKFAEVQNMSVSVKTAYMEQMNRAVSPFVICLIMLLGICVPKRILPVRWLNRFSAALIMVVIATALGWGVVTALQLNLWVTLILQTIVLLMALAGSEYLSFEKKGYWVRVGSSAMHLGLILFILDLFLYKHQNLHLALFWVTTLATVVGMIGCFYSDSLVGLIKKIKCRLGNS